MGCGRVCYGTRCIYVRLMIPTVGLAVVGMIWWYGMHMNNGEDSENCFRRFRSALTSHTTIIYNMVVWWYHTIPYPTIPHHTTYIW